MSTYWKVDRRWLVLGCVAALAGTPVLAGWKEGTSLPALGSFQLEGTPPATAGKVVLVDFWASWCGPCRQSFPVLDNLQKQYGREGLVVIGVNVDKDSAAMKKFLSEHPVAFAVVRDAAQKLVGKADVQSMPASFLVDRQGNVRFIHTGFHGEKTAEEYAKEIQTLLGEKGAAKR
jgi:thiol-disulfide isomerase/thioredoxin